MNVPVKRSLVNGARLKLESILGFVLYRMQGIKLKIKKQKGPYWTEMKNLIMKFYKKLVVDDVDFVVERVFDLWGLDF